MERLIPFSSWDAVTGSVLKVVSSPAVDAELNLLSVLLRAVTCMSTFTCLRRVSLSYNCLGDPWFHQKMLKTISSF